jgi:uncharacterized damage-inducible protein DinB
VEAKEVAVEFSLANGKEVLGRTPNVLFEMLRDLSDSWSLGDEGPETWSSYQVVGHMLHIEESDWMDRTRLILEHGAEGVFEPIDREAGFARFSGWKLGEIVDRFGTVRRSNLAELDARVGEADLDRIATHPDFGTVSLRQLLAAWVVHDLNHLGQIVKTMAKQYSEAVGPWRAYLPIIDAR